MHGAGHGRESVSLNLNGGAKTKTAGVGALTVRDAINVYYFYSRVVLKVCIGSKLTPTLFAPSSAQASSLRYCYE